MANESKVLDTAVQKELAQKVALTRYHPAVRRFIEMNNGLSLEESVMVSVLVPGPLTNPDLYDWNQREGR